MNHYVGDIFLLVQILLVLAFISIHYFLNLLIDFDQTCKSEHQNVSKTCLKFYVKIMDNVRATVYQLAIPYDSKVAI